MLGPRSTWYLDLMAMSTNFGHDNQDDEAANPMIYIQKTKRVVGLASNCVLEALERAKHAQHQSDLMNRLLLQQLWRAAHNFPFEPRVCVGAPASPSLSLSRSISRAPPLLLFLSLRVSVVVSLCHSLFVSLRFCANESMT